MPTHADYPMPTMHKRLTKRPELSAAFETDMDNLEAVYLIDSIERTSYFIPISFNYKDSTPVVKTKAKLADLKFNQRMHSIKGHAFELALSRRNPDPGSTATMRTSNNRMERLMCHGEFVDCIFSECSFINTDLVDAKFNSCIFFDCKFDKCAGYRVKFTNCIFLSTTFLFGAWREAEFLNCSLYKVVFGTPQMKVSSLPLLKDVSFRNSKLVDAEFQGDVFKNTSFPMSRLIGVEFVAANLADVILDTAAHVDIVRMPWCFLTDPNHKHFISLNVCEYSVLCTSYVVQIGCQAFSMQQLQDCLAANDEDLHALSPSAPSLAKKHLKWLLKTIERFKPEHLPYEW